MSKPSINRLILLLSLLGMSLLLTACDRKSINEIKAEPHRYANKEVGIVGNVVDSYSVLGRGAFLVDDGTGRLWVVSEKGVPRKGSRVGVKGKIRDGFNLGSFVKLPDPISSGMVMVAESYKAK